MAIRQSQFWWECQAYFSPLIRLTIDSINACSHATANTPVYSIPCHLPVFWLFTAFKKLQIDFYDDIRYKTLYTLRMSMHLFNGCHYSNGDRPKPLSVREEGSSANQRNIIWIGVLFVFVSMHVSVQSSILLDEMSGVYVSTHLYRYSKVKKCT